MNRRTILIILGLAMAIAFNTGFPPSAESRAPGLLHKGLPSDVPVPGWAKHRKIMFFPLPEAGSRGSRSIQRGGGHPRKPWSGEATRCETNYCPHPPLEYNPTNEGVQHNPRLQVIFWGSNWNTSPGLATREEVMKLLNGLSGSSFQNILTQYFDATGRISSTVTVATPYVDTSVAAPTEVEGGAIRGEAEAAVEANGWTPQHDDQFIVLPAPGTKYTNSKTIFCAYHEDFGAAGLDFVPYMGDPPFNACLKIDSEKNPTRATTFGLSHEYAEAATNPHVGPISSTWVTNDLSHFEIADICPFEDQQLPNGTWVTTLWDNYLNDCVLSDSGAPQVMALTGEATELGNHGVTIHAKIFPEKAKTEYKFEYGPTTEYGTSVPVPAASVEAGSATDTLFEVQARLENLAIATNYHYRIVATNNTGTFPGGDRAFLSPGPVVIAEPATGLQSTSANLRGSIEPHGISTTYYFEYGRTAEYEASIPVPEASAGAEGIFRAKQTITGLEPRTTYHFRLVAVNAEATVTGQDESFATPEWEYAPTADAEGTKAVLQDVSCSSAEACVGVGSYRDGSGVTTAFVERRSGSTWTVPKAAVPSGAQESQLEGVACRSTEDCMAVGFYKTGSGAFAPMAEHWDGSAWSLLSVPIPSGSTGSWLTDLSCPSANWCSAVGRVVNSGATSTLAEQWNGAEWTLQTPVSSGSFAALEDVSCAAVGDCWAVGNMISKFITHTLLEHLSGGEWTLQTLSESPERLIGISCPSLTSCMAVSGSGRGLQVERFDGEHWTKEVPPGLPTEVGSSFGGVSCGTSSHCLVLSNTDSISDPNSVLEWDSGKWATQAVSNQSSAPLRSISCVNVMSCAAVGSFGSITIPTAKVAMETHIPAQPPSVAGEKATGVNTQQTLRAIVSPHRQATSYQFEYGTTTGYGAKVPLAAKSIGSDNGSIAVSESLEGLSPDTTYHFRVAAENATGVTHGQDAEFSTWGSWSTQTTTNPTPPATQALLEGVSCPSSTTCLAAGEDQQRGLSLGELWNGTEWKSLFAGSGEELPSGHRNGISCASSTSCLVVGFSASEFAAAETWFSVFGNWAHSTKTPPNPEGATYVRLQGVSCTSTSACTAVGYYSKEGVLKTLAERWNGTSWSIQTTANPGSGSAELLGVSCDSSTSCTAVGSQGKSTFAERWNGTTWSISSTPNPSGASESSLKQVSCTAASACMAVGYFKEASGYNKTLVERWNGSAWSVVASPNPGAAKGSFLVGVSCASSNSCIAVGRYVTEGEIFPSESKTLVESWGGSEWSIQSSTNPSEKKLPFLRGVSCSAANACTAAGYAKKGLGEVETTTLGERYQ